MEHQLGRVYLVSWQGRPTREQARPRAVSLALVGLAALSGLLLLLRFAAGVSVPLGLLQVAFAVLVAACAFLLTRAAVRLILRLQRR